MEAAKQVFDSSVDAFKCQLWPKNDGATDSVIKVEAFPESEAIPAAGKDEFPVLVRVTAAASQKHIGVDVVAVLDISKSMEGEKLEEVKNAMNAFIDKLGDEDRLSIVTFWSEAKRDMGLTYMIKDEREKAKKIVNELKVKSDTKMGAGLAAGAKVLSEREDNSRLGCMLFLSDGKDDGIYDAQISEDFPAYTFGMGADHDSKALKHIADVTRGTYSFVNKDTSKITGAIKLFAAGITSIAATSVTIILKASKGTTISSIESGGYSNEVKEDKCSGFISIPDIYAGEVKNFIVYLKITAEATGGNDHNGRDQKILIMTVDRSYQILDNSVQRLPMQVCVLPVPLPPRRRYWWRDQLAIHPEVAAELTRISLVKGIFDMVCPARPEEQPSDPKPPIRITGDGLKNLWKSIRGSTYGKATPYVILWKLDKEVAEMQTRMIDGATAAAAAAAATAAAAAAAATAAAAAAAGATAAATAAAATAATAAAAAASDDGSKSWLPYVLSWLSSHNWQRATTKDRLPGGNGYKIPCWPESNLIPVVVVVALFFFLAAVIGYYSGGHGYGYGFGFGLNPAAAPGNATAIDLSGHPAWPAMEQDLQAITRRTEDVQITSYFQEASVEDMNLQMDRYLYMAIVHATVLRRRSMGYSISDKLAVRREAESYLRIMLTRMKNVEIPSFQGSSAEFITYEMNRYLYSTIVQASVLRSSYTSGQDVAIDNLSERMINLDITPVVVPTTPGAFIDDSVLIIDDSVLITSATTSAAATITSETITVLEEQKETLVVKVTELEQSRETLMVRITEMEMVLRERETLVVSLRSELVLQRESCAQRAAMVEAQLRTCTQTVDMWKAKVVAMGGLVDDEDHKVIA